MKPFNFSSNQAHTKAMIRWHQVSIALVVMLVTPLGVITYSQWQQIHQLNIQAEHQTQQNRQKESDAQSHHKNIPHQKKLFSSLLHDLQACIPDDVYLETLSYIYQSCELTGYALLQSSACHFLDTHSHLPYVQAPTWTLSYYDRDGLEYTFTYTCALSSSLSH